MCQTGYSGAGACALPTSAPTLAPTMISTVPPTPAPTRTVTIAPSPAPVFLPTPVPTHAITLAPTIPPTATPEPTRAITLAPTLAPSSLLLGDWVVCTLSTECANGCCSLKYSAGILKCTPNTGPDKVSEGCMFQTAAPTPAPSQALCGNLGYACNDLATCIAGACVCQSPLAWNGTACADITLQPTVAPTLLPTATLSPTVTSVPSAVTLMPTPSPSAATPTAAPSTAPPSTAAPATTTGDNGQCGPVTGTSCPAAQCCRTDNTCGVGSDYCGKSCVSAYTAGGLCDTGEQLSVWEQSGIAIVVGIASTIGASAIVAAGLAVHRRHAAAAARVSARGESHPFNVGVI